MQKINRGDAKKYAFDWRDEPLLRVQPGESFEIETWDASTGFFKTEDDKAIPANRPARAESVANASRRVCTYRVSECSSDSSGGRTNKRRNNRVARSVSVVASTEILRPACLARSVNITSLSSVSACSGLLLRLRRAIQASPDGASNVVNIANGAVRRE